MTQAGGHRKTALPAERLSVTLNFPEIYTNILCFSLLGYFFFAQQINGIKKHHRRHDNGNQGLQ